MKTFDGTAFAKTFNGFIRYVKHQAMEFKIRDEAYKYMDAVVRYSKDDFLEIQRVLCLDRRFMKLTTEDEKEAINYTRYHNPDVPEPKELMNNLHAAYNKWFSVFYSKSKIPFSEIDPIIIGKQIEYLRFMNLDKQTSLARLIGVNRTTLMDIEKGYRLPSLEFIYKLSIIYRISIDDLINAAVVENLHDVPSTK